MTRLEESLCDTPSEGFNSNGFYCDNKFFRGVGYGLLFSLAVWTSAFFIGDRILDSTLPARQYSSIPK